MTMLERQFQDVSFADGGFAETLLYHPAGAPSPRSIRAIVDRGAAGALAPMPGSLASGVVIAVRNQEDGGILSSEINFANDRVTIPDRVGGPNKSMKIVRIVSHDAGIVNLEIK